MAMPRRRALAARLSYAAMSAAVGASIPYFGVFFQERGLDLGVIGLLTALGAAAALVAAPAWGVLADRYAESPLVIPLAALLSAASGAALALATGLGAMAAAFIALSMAFAGIGPTLDARSLETVAGDRDRYARIRVWGSVSFIVIVSVTGALIERAGVASLFAVFIGCVFVLAVVSLPLRGNASPRLPRLSAIRIVLTYRPLARFLAAVLLVWSASMAINWVFSIHLLALGAPGELIGSSWAIGAMIEVPIMAAYPWLAARFGGQLLIAAGAGAFALRALALALTNDPVIAAATMALHGAAFALVLVGGVTFVSRHAPVGTAATAQAILSAVVFSVSMIVGPGVGAWIAEVAGIGALMVAATIASTLAIPLLLVATRGQWGTTEER